MSDPISIPLVIRGGCFTGDVEHGGRRGGAAFRTADVAEHIDRLALSRPSEMADLYALKFDDILDYLDELGQRLAFDRNPHMQQAFRLSCQTSGLSDSILEAQYRGAPGLFRREMVRENAELSVGIDYLEGWVPQPCHLNHAPTRTLIRAFGARAVHVIAGNSPVIAMQTVIRNAYTRSDAIIKTPSNDPMTATAIALTMIEMAPDHPLTRHLSVAYWKGGDEGIEEALYDPRRIEKIIAWGGFASVRHITRYLQPGIDLITLDPKLSGTIIGREAFADEASLNEAARLLALDAGTMNQEACVNARVVYAECGTDDSGLAAAKALAEKTYAALQALPARISTPHKAFDAGLREELEGLRYAKSEYHVVGTTDGRGAVIVSLDDAPVDFAAQLACRVVNVVPVDDVEIAVRSTNAYTQTVGVYPEPLKERLRDRLAFQGAQRIVSLGGAVPVTMRSGPHDGIEPVRRMVKWLSDESTASADLLAAAAPEAEAVPVE